MRGNISLEVHVLSVLKLRTSSTVSDLEDVMKGLSVCQLKAICMEMGLKKLGHKAELIDQLLTMWQVMDWRLAVKKGWRKLYHS